jgi:type I restriction enzyme S subunit
MRVRPTPWGPRPEDWALVPWKAFARRAGTPIKVDSGPHKQVTVRVRHQGVVERRINPSRGQIIETTNQVRVASGQFIISKIDARNGACGFIPESLDGAIVTNDFPLYQIDGADARYLHHLVDLSTFWRLCESVSDGTTNRVRLDLDQFDQLQFPLPPLPEQRAIAAVLDAIDDAIERTEAAIAATEELRRALLHDLLSRGVPGWHSEWKHVPGVGTVPACWEITTLGNLCAPPQYGAGAPARPFDARLPRYVRITDLTEDGGLRPDEARSADPALVAGYELASGDLLFARSGATVGKTYLYRSEDGPCVFAGYLIRFRPVPGVVDPEFLELWTRSQFYERWISSMFRAGAQPNINASEYGSLPTPRAPLPEQKRIVEMSEAIRMRLQAEHATRAYLASIRTASADALLTGRLRVRYD